MAQHQIQRNRRTGEYRHLTERGWEPYTPMPEETPERYLPGLADTPTTAAVNELLRTGKEAGIGLARSPLDALKGLFQLATSPVESVKGLASAVTDPRATMQALTDNPREAGSLLGQLLLGKVGIPKIPGAAARVPGAVSAAGRGLETAGTTLAESKIGGFGIPGLGAAEAIIQGDPRGALVAAAPYAMKYGGQGLQQVGSGLERLKEAVLRLQELPREPGVPPLRPARVSTEVPYRIELPLETPTASGPPIRDNFSDMLGARRTPVSENPLLQALPPPELDAWAALRQMRTRAEAVPQASEIPGRVTRAAVAGPRNPVLDQLNRDLTTSATPGEIRTRLIRAAPPVDLPASWQPFTENPVTQDLLRVLDELRRRPTRGLTNPTGQ